MEYIALICARGGSKGLSNKNIKCLNGIPLIGRSISIAKEISRIKRVIVSTDSYEIAEVAKKFGAEVPFMRPDELAQDDSPEWLVWRHALDYLSKSDPISYDGLVSIPATAPLRIAEDVENCLNEFEKGDSDIVITVSDAHRNPYFNMVEIHESGLSTLVMSPTQTIFRRQDAPEVYDMTTVAYVANFDYIQKASGIFDGRVRSVHVPLERSLDIDTLMDFKFAEYLIHNQEGEAL